MMFFMELLRKKILEALVITSIGSFRTVYLSIPQAFGSSGGHMGTGMAEVFPAMTLVWAEAEVIWVDAAAPVRARTTTNARTKVFTVLLLKLYLHF